MQVPRHGEKYGVVPNMADEPLKRLKKLAKIGATVAETSYSANHGDEDPGSMRSKPAFLENRNFIGRMCLIFQVACVMYNCTILVL